MLGAVAILLAVTRLGMIPMPTGVNATIMHIPAILGGVVEGPGVGALVGLIFGLYSFLYSGRFFADPLVSILPRLLIGPAAYYVRRATGSVALAAALGTATNTVGVLGMAVLRGYLPAKAAGVIALTHGLPEMVVAVVLVVPIARALARWRGGHSPAAAAAVRKRREQGEKT
ncbi:MAG: ECF transporter S component [Thermogemmatispora sp.]|nr:ECF transporter S component [Thermogemmatispora sp.]